MSDIKKTNTNSAKTRVKTSVAGISQSKNHVKQAPENRLSTQTFSKNKSKSENANLTQKSANLETASKTSNLELKTTNKLTSKSAKRINNPNALTTKKPLDTIKSITTENNRRLTPKSSSRKATTNVKLTASTKPNLVLDTYHNVTISSPPTKRKDSKSNAETVPTKTLTRKKTELSVDKTKLAKLSVATPTKAAISFEVDFSKNSVKKLELTENTNKSKDLGINSKENSNLESKFNDDCTSNCKSKENEKNEKIPKPEAQAILNFNDSSTVETKCNETKLETKEIVKEEIKDDSETNYSDDFETYESDFETDVSSNTSTSLDNSKKSLSLKESRSEKDQSNDNKTTNDTENEDDDEEDSDLTQNPITVIQRDRELKHDSGNYEINLKKSGEKGFSKQQQTHLATLSFGNLDQQDHLSLETTSLVSISASVSEQWDSGICGYDSRQLIDNNTNKNNQEMFDYNELQEDTLKIKVVYDGYDGFVRNPIITSCGLELMNKIQFDIIEFQLFDLKPTAYENYIRIYGNINSQQNSTQTRDDWIEMDVQTEDVDYRCVWTQHPGFYNHQQQNSNINNYSLQTNISCVDEDQGYDINLMKNNWKLSKSIKEDDNELEQSIKYWMKLRRESDQRKTIRKLNKTTTNIDLEALNRFLLRSSLVMTQILQDKDPDKTNYLKEDISYVKGAEQLKEITQKSFTLNVNFLNSLKVKRIFANNQYDLLITVHESLPENDVYREDFANLIMIWSLSIQIHNKPIRLLSSWSEINYLNISNQSLDILVAALRDGSIALWDLRETYTFCSKLDGQIVYFTPTQTILPNYGQTSTLEDSGACLDIRSFRSSSTIISSLNGRNHSQFVSLHESGLVTVWTLVETSMDFLQQNHNTSLDYTSPWARVKLTQSSIIQLRDYLSGGKSIFNENRHFSKTKELFQRNIYSDKILQEFNAIEMGQSLMDSDQRRYRRLLVRLEGLRFNCLDVGCENIYICCNRNLLVICTKSLQKERLRQIYLDESPFLFPTNLKVLSNEYYVVIGYSNGAVIIVNCNFHGSINTPRINEKKSMKEIRTNLSRGKTTSGNKSSLNDYIGGKSCAIQNIILNEKQQQYSGKDNDSSMKLSTFRPDTAAINLSLIRDQCKPYEIRLQQEQQLLILPGSILRQDLIQNLELSSDGWRLFALSNGRLRIYDFFLDRELETSNSGSIFQEQSSKGQIVEMVSTILNKKTNQLILLKDNNTIDIYLLKK